MHLDALDCTPPLYIKMPVDIFTIKEFKNQKSRINPFPIQNFTENANGLSQNDDR